MKTILSFICVLACAFGAFAQGNLQFNQVRNIAHTSVPKMLADPSNPSTGNYIYHIYRLDSTVMNVPANKVLKIESMSFGYISTFTVPQSSSTASIQAPNIPYSAPSGFLYGYVFIDNTLVLPLIYGNQQLNQVFPLWLSAGNHTIKVVYNSVSYNSPTSISSVPENVAQPCKVSISAIEFNIIP